MVMVLVVTGVGFLIHVYSIGYMHGDGGVRRYFAYLNLFTFAMLILVTADNLLLLFVGWEGVGLCSYLLIGYWYEKDSAANAGKKAFIVNRIGDFGFILATMLTFWSLGTVSFQEISHLAPQELAVGGGIVTAIALLFFLGAAGKSAQIPLYVWLPDAMEGPTPVSALIHAATMVTAGVYLLARMHVVYAMAPVALLVVLAIGSLTALFAGTIGLAQTDIKKVLAYSTISQLGFMFSACGVGAFVAAIFHLVTHAFFKALLFLGSGSVIHGMKGEQEMPKMGGLRAKMPGTFPTFLIGAGALAGLPPLAGFFSKDEILWEVFAQGHVLFWLILALAALFTGLYVTRVIILTFYGAPRDRHLFDHAHESPPVMLIPLRILAFLSAAGGLIGIPILAGGHRLKSWLEPVMGGSKHGALQEAHEAGRAAVAQLQYPLRSPAQVGHNVPLEIAFIVISVIVSLAGILVAVRLYRGSAAGADRIRQTWGGLHRLLAGKYFVDELYHAAVVRPVKAISDVLWRVLDVQGIDGAVNGIGGFMKSTGDEIRRWQNGLAQSYAMAIMIGTLILMAFVLMGRWV
jgi:NADH-quinone oxidoreductase subunit L